MYEDEEFRVILDLGPATKGHALILPKEHYANLYEIPEETAGKSIILAKKMVTRMKKADIKRFLAIYFEASMNGDLMPDYDGEQYISEVENEEA